MVSPMDWNPSVFHKELKKIYGIVPQSLTDWHPSVFHRVEKFLQNCATITDGVTDRFTDGLRTSWSARMSETWSVDMFTDGYVGTFTDRITVGTFTDGSKSLAGIFIFFGADINSLPMEFNATNNNKCPSVIPSEKLLFKTPLLPFGSFFLLALHLYFSSTLRLYLVFGRDFIVLVVVLNILKGMYSFFFIFVFFFNYDYFFGVLCFVYCL